MGGGRLWCVAILISAVVAAVAADKCTFSTGAIVPFDDALSCIRGVPFDQDIFVETLDTVEKSVPLYVFVDIAQDSPDPVNYPSQVNLYNSVESIREKTFACDYDFQRAVQDMFRPLHDGHTLYYMPSCYTNFKPLQPLLLVSYVENNEVKIGISGLVAGMADAYSDIFNIQLDELVGGVVLSINKTNAVDYIFQFANTSVGSAKDVNIRYNIALTRYLNTSAYTLGSFTSRTSSPAPVMGETVEYVIQTGASTKTIYMPWVASVIDAVDSFEAFSTWCFSPAASPSAERVRQIEKQEVYHTSPHPSEATTGFTITPLHIGQVSFYQIAPSTAVMVIPTFEPSNYVQFGKDLEIGLELLVTQNLHRLIVDVSNNGGGDLCLGYTVVEMLFAEFSPYGANDMNHSPLAITLAEKAVELGITDTYWSPQKWIDYYTNETFPPTVDWFIPGIPHVRGGIPGNYSQLFRDGCDIYFKLLPQPAGIHYKPSQLRILSNGYCGSTCSVFSRHMQEFDGVKTVAVGGLPSMVLSVSATPGGQVVEVSEIVGMIEELGEDKNPLSPQNFPTTAVMRFTLREIYPFNPFTTEVPLEFYYEEADYHISYNLESASNPALVWKDALKTFFN